MNWIDANYSLPEDKQTVLIKTKEENVFGWKNELMQYHVATFVKGKTKEEVEKSGILCFGDEHGNNLVPYEWDGDGPCDWWGQEVTHWAKIDAVK